MTSPKPKKYRLRNKQHIDLGQFTAKEIIKKIRGGKLSGDEEISTPPTNKWQKLASHSDFYDAFLKRIYEDQYQSPKGENDENSHREKSANDGATRQGQKTKFVKEEKDENGKTHRIQDEGFKEFGATIRQSLIDELFQDGSKDVEKESVEAGTQIKKGTDLIQLETPELYDSSVEGGTERHKPLHSENPIAEDASLFSEEPEARENNSQKTRALSKENRRRLFMVVGLTVMLVILFSEGQKPAGPAAIVAENSAELPSRQLIGTQELKEERLKSLMDEGDGLYALDVHLAYAAALEVFRSALKLDESNPKVLGRIAMTAARLLPESSRPEALSKEMTQAVLRGRAFDPHLSAFYRAESLEALHNQKTIEARRLALNAIEADPSDGENHLTTAEIFLQAGELSQAKIAAEDAIKAAPYNVRARITMAQIAFDQKDLARARNEGVEALKLNPLHPSTYLLLADTMALQNQLKEARGFYETCGRLAKFSTKLMTATAFYRLAMLLEGANETALASKYYRLAYFYDKSLKGLSDKVNGLDTSEEALRVLASETEYGKNYFQTQGDGLVKQGKLKQSIRFFQAASLAEPNDGLALIRLGDIIEKTASSYEDYHLVMNLYQRAIEKSPEQPMGYIRLGVLETEQYEIERAYKHLTQAQALAPNDSAPYVALGKHHYKRQDYNEALNQFLKAAKINPSDAEVNYYAGLLRLLFKKDGVKDAPKFFYQAYTLDPQNYDALAEWLKLKVLNYEKNFAVKFVRNLMDVEPNNPKLLWVLGEVYVANQEFRRGISFFHQSLDIDNRSAKVRMSLGKALEAIGDFDKAVAEFRLASLLDRRNSEGFYRAADLLFKMKRYNEADEILKYLINVTPNYPGAHRYRAQIHRLRKQKTEAIALMKMEVDKSPHNPKYRLDLAEFYMEYEMYPDAIKQLMEVTSLPSVAKAPEYVFDKTRAYLLLSRCYRLQGKPESAEGPIKLALEIDSNDPELHRELGYVYYAMQRDKEGVRAFETYLSRNPAAKDAAAIKSLIQQMMIEE